MLTVDHGVSSEKNITISLSLITALFQFNNPVILISFAFYV